MNSEIIKFELDFYPEYVDNDFPRVSISIDSETKFDGSISDSQSSVFFLHTLEFDQSHQLNIKRQVSLQFAGIAWANRHPYGYLIHLRQ